ncbi:retrovirus-related pol polyprotein from transposon TNT 1-94 [Tanacetum coccineum]|uniref:Retrovirus-related pol polyprotein from transposon TNT 1-94 n=1 Tax=Tanacetum coccineum TaxID=301880 RepID=A0ABQ5AP01_9ASTR
MVTQSLKVDRKDWNGKMTQKLGLGFGFTKKACFVCGSHNHLIKDCDFHEKRMPKESVLRKGIGHKEVRPIWNNTQRINHQNKFVPTTVLTRSGRIPVSIAKQYVNTATPKNRVNVSKSKINTFSKSHSPIRRPFYKPTVLNTRVSKEKVNTVRVNGVNTVKRNGITAVKASAGCVLRPKKTNLNNGSKDNSGSWISKRVNYIDPQGRLKGIHNKIIRDPKSAIQTRGMAKKNSGEHAMISYIQNQRRTNHKDFQNCLFACFLSQHEPTKISQALDDKKLKFNLFSVSQMCDKKNTVLFTETECLVLPPDFKLLDESQGNLVRGLPSKIFDNDHTCVACQKGKQHKASCKAKLMSSISQPLQMLHMDFFGLTSVRSVNHKTYCLVVTDDFNRFSWLDNASRLLSTLLVFWAEAVNTACYVLNRVLVTNPHNKTPYELIMDRPPSISFIRPFGCHVTILNTLDPLGKFDGKAEEGFLVGYKSSNERYKNDITDDDAGETPIQKPTSENEQALKNGASSREGYKASSTSSFNTVSTPVNASSAPRTSNDDGPSFIPLSGSFHLNVNDLLDDPLMPNLEHTVEVQNTGIFGSAFDDEDLDTYNSPFADQVMGGLISTTWNLQLLSMIGSLMYLTSSRPDIMFSVVHAQDFKFNKKIVGGICMVQFGQEIHNRRLSISWFKIKIHVDNESAICIIKNPVYHSKTKHIEIQHHFIRDSYEKRLIEMVKIHTDNNVADLLTEAFDGQFKSNSKLLSAHLSIKARQMKESSRDNLDFYSWIITQEAQGIKSRIASMAIRVIPWLDLKDEISRSMS